MHETSSTLSRYGLPTGIYRTADGLYDPMAVIEICKGLLQDFALSPEVPRGTRKALEASPTWKFQWKEKARTLDDVYKALRAFAATLPRIEDARYEVAVGKLPHAWTSSCWQNAVTFPAAPALWACTFTGGWHVSSHIKVVYEEGTQTKVAQVRVSNAGLVNLKPWEGRNISIMRTTTALLTPVVGSIDMKELEGAIHRLYLACMDCGGFVPVDEDQVRASRAALVAPHPKVAGWDYSPITLKVPKGTRKAGRLGQWIVENVIHTWREDNSPATIGGGSPASWRSFLGLDQRTFVTNVSAIVHKEGYEDGPNGVMRRFQEARREAWKLETNQIPHVPDDLTLGSLDLTHGLLLRDDSGAVPGVTRPSARWDWYVRAPQHLPDQVVFLPYIYAEGSLRGVGSSKFTDKQTLINVFNEGRATVVAVLFDTMFFYDDMSAETGVYTGSLMARETIQYRIVPIRAVMFEEEQ